MRALEPDVDGVRCTFRAGFGASRAGWEMGVKKVIVVLAAAVAGFAVWRKLESDKAEQALWAEVTDPVK